MVAAVGLLLGGCSDDPGGTVPPAALEKQVREFFLGMASEQPYENRRAMSALMPIADDFEAIAPGHGEALWAVWGKEARRLVETASEPRDEYRAVLPIRGIRTVDLRTDASIVLSRSLDALPPELPVYGVVIEVSPGERAASAFVPLRGRWVWIWNLERIGSLLAKPAAQ